MDINNIKPIPKYMLALIKKQDKKECINKKSLRFYCYLAVWKKQLVKVTVAVRNFKNVWHCKQVAVHGIHSEFCAVKDIEYNGYIGMGYRVGWYTDGLTKHQRFYDDGKWYTAKDKYYDPCCTIINADLLNKINKYKYSAGTLYRGTNILRYLRLYEQYPQTEYLLKLGFNNLVESKTILNKISKDMNFSKWLLRNKQTILSYNYYIRAIMQAYKNKTTIAFEQQKEKIKIQNKQGLFYRFKQDYFYNFDELIEYIIRKNTSMQNYIDYYNACTYLGLDMGQERNRLPKDFSYWHDVRIDEYSTKKALMDKILKEELYNKFSDIAHRFSPLEKNSKKGIAIIIAKSPNDLIIEGDVLNHCVGRMNYEQKIIRGESLIFFIRDKNSLDRPLYTLEYSIAKRKVLQCYGENNSKPDKAVQHYVDKVWLPYANRKLKQITQLKTA